MTTSEETGLDTRAAGGVITSPKDYVTSLQRWLSNKYNVLTPFSNVTGLAAQHGLIASMVQLDLDPTKGDVYDKGGGLPWLTKDEVAPAKAGLRKLAECGGISTRTERTDPRTIPHYWEFKAIGSYRGVDGSIVTREATMEWDLRDGSDRLKGFTPNQITEARKNGLRNCETRAINAVIRECGCGLKQKYTKTELAKPFVVIRVVFQPDMTDPVVKKLVTENALRGTSTLYPAAARELPAHVDEEPQSELKQVGAGSTTAAPPAPAKPTTHGPLQKVDVSPIQRRDKTGTFNKWTAIDFAGVPHVTVKREFGEALERLDRTKTPVEIVSHENSYNENEIDEINPIDEPAQSGLPLQDKL